jgi:hypothetical protein
MDIVFAKERTALNAEATMENLEKPDGCILDIDSILPYLEIIPSPRGCSHDNAAPAYTYTTDQSAQRKAQPCLTALALITAAMCYCSMQS